jgi:magnesium-transporting ATPase (P-type)
VGTEPTLGLSSAEAAERLEKNGKNALAEGKKKTFLSRLLAQFSDMMIIVLLVAAAISAVLSIVEHKPEDLDTDGEDHIADEWRYFCMSRPIQPLLPEELQPHTLYDNDPLNIFA